MDIKKKTHEFMEIKPEVNEINKLFRDIHKYIVHFTKENLKEEGLTKPRFMVLWYVSKCQPVNISSLHNKMYMANSTLTVIVDKLVESDLINRYRNPDDRRVVLLELTKNGEKKIKKMLNLREAYLQKALVDFNLDEQKRLIELLNSVYINLKNMEDGDAKDE